jgi:hypothetical protein
MAPCFPDEPGHERLDTVRIYSQPDEAALEGLQRQRERTGGAGARAAPR